MKKIAMLTAVLILVIGAMAFGGPYLAFEQSLLPTGPGMPACEVTAGIDYSLGNFVVQTGSALTINGDLYVTSPDMWSLTAATVGHELNLGWPQVDIDLVTEVDLGLAALSADLKLTGYVADWLTLYGKVESTYSPTAWGIEPFIGVEFRW